jgi:hypothetical protein
MASDPSLSDERFTREERIRQLELSLPQAEIDQEV